MSTWRLVVEYEGTRYRGWQEQHNTPRTVAGALRRALEGAGCEVEELMGSGRTDAGVHALAQVAHLRGRFRGSPEGLRLAVNDQLPHDVHVLALETAADRFHARHHALLRSYLYQVARRRTALAKPFVWWVRDPLDAGRMAQAAALLSGMHDFRNFCEQPAAQTSTRVKVSSAEVAEEGALVLVRVVASHFLWKMIRRLVGTLVEVGAGRLTPSDVVALLDAEATVSDAASPALHTAPPSGLFLERVLYPGDPPLGSLRSVTPIADEPRQGGRRSQRDRHR